MKCRICGAAAEAMLVSTKKSSQTYYRCGRCGFVRLAPRHRITKADEKARYLLHRNDASNGGYVSFLESFVSTALSPYLKPGAQLLDFGSGPSPSPLLAKRLLDLGYRCDSYDPIFLKTRSWRKRSYDAILLHEVAEHLWNPQAAFSSLVERLKAGGIIAIRTQFIPPSTESFRSWWYRMDPTHVSFYTPRCLSDFFWTKGFTLLTLAEPDIILFKKG